MRQLDEAAETDLSQRKIAPNKPFFQNNVGIGGQAFTDKHPYYETLKDNVEKKKVFIASERLMPKPEIKAITVAHKKAIYKKPFNQQFEAIEKYGKGKLSKHKLYKQGDDHADLMDYGTYKAKNGFDVRMLPEVHESELEARELLQAGAKKKSNVDFWINGEWWELESPRILENVRKRVNSGYLQCNNVIINLPIPLSKSKCWNEAANRFRSKLDLQQIIFYNSETEYYFSRDILLLE